MNESDRSELEVDPDRSGPVREGTGRNDATASPELQYFAGLDPSLLPGLLERIPFGVLIVSAPTGHWLAGNAEFERIVGERPPVIANVTAYLDRRLHGIDDGATPSLTEWVLEQGETVTDLPVRFERADGHSIDLMLSAAPIHDSHGSVTAAVVVCREIKAGGEPGHFTAIWVRADLFATLSLVAANRLRDTFLATAAHELRTPLTTISGFSQLLERQLAKPNPDPERLLVLTRELREQVTRMVNLADDLMKAITAQDDQVSSRKQVCNVGLIVRVALDRIRLLPEFTGEHRLALDLPDDVTAFCDPEHLDQIISNLVSNALKYSPDGGEVRVRAQRVDDRVELSISDEGIGMSPDEQARLWQAFVRFGPLKREVSGTGLGLYIVRRLVERNDGTIAVKSAPGQGSSFTISLPAWPVKPDRRSSRASFGL